MVAAREHHPRSKAFPVAVSDVVDNQLLVTRALAGLGAHATLKQDHFTNNLVLVLKVSPHALRRAVRLMEPFVVLPPNAQEGGRQ